VNRRIVWLAVLGLVAGLLAFAPSAGAAGSSAVDGPDDRALPAPGPAPRAGNIVCYYDTALGMGNAGEQEPPIVTAGHTPVNVATPNAAGLAGCDVLFVQNPNNGLPGAEWFANLADVDAFVMSGGVLIFHDRGVTDSDTYVPGLGPCVRDFTDEANIQVQNGGTAVTNGPGGIVGDATLDGGTSSSHGFCPAGTLPPGSLNILSTGTPANSVTHSYPYGAGSVVYSTIPLDFYLGGNDPAAFREIYGPNVVQYGVNLFTGVVADTCDGFVPTIVGTPGDDIIRGTTGDDVISGGDGNDELYGRGGNDVLCGGPGDDRLQGNGGDDLIMGEDGNDLLLGGAGADMLRGGRGEDVLKGHGGPDDLNGGAQDDFLNGGGGDDYMDGGAGNDKLVGSTGNDKLRGREGDDALYGQNGDDDLAGTSGDDFLHGGQGFDLLDGGGDTDTCKAGEILNGCEA